MRTVKEIISETIGVPVEQITEELSIGDVPQWSSMANMTIIGTIESEFGVEIPVEDLFELTNVASIEDEVEKLKNGIA